MVKIIDLPGILVDRQRLLELARFFSKYEGTCLLYSGDASAAAAANTHSFLCLFPFETVEHYASSKLSGCINPWDLLKMVLKKPDQPHPFPEWVGFLSYEMGAYAFDKNFGPVDIENANSQHPLPDFYFQRCSLVIEINHQNNNVCMIVAEGKPEMGPLESQWIESLSDPRFWPGFFRRLGGPLIGSPPEKSDYELFSSEPVESYCNKVLQAQEWIRAGDIYQLNLSHQLIFKGKGDGFQIFEDLATKNPAPFSSYLNHKDFCVVSSSPESFLRKKLSSLETRPIKGTAPRGLNPIEDAQNRERLLASEKERSELLMIVDLMRNDLGKISSPGTVVTEKIWGCETYTNVFHLVATIKSELSPGWDPIDAVRACFPGGSITGCPKLKSMEYIHKLENRRRNIYTGSIGYFSGDGDFDFNIAIPPLCLKAIRSTFS